VVLQAVAGRGKRRYDVAENIWLADEISAKYLDELGEGYNLALFYFKTFRRCR
jgi:hypothetical protein